MSHFIVNASQVDCLLPQPNSKVCAGHEGSTGITAGRKNSYRQRSASLLHWAHSWSLNTAGHIARNVRRFCCGEFLRTEDLDMIFVS